MAKNNLMEIIFFLILLIACGVVVFFLFLPFLNAIIVAGVMAIIFGPVNKKILYFLGGRRGLSAFFTVIIVLVGIFIPFTLLGFVIFGEANTLYSSLNEEGFNLVSSKITQILQDLIVRFDIPPLSLDFNLYLRQILVWLLQNLGPLVTGIAEFLLKAFFSFLGFFYFLKEGDKLKARLIYLLPLRQDYTELLFDSIKKAVNSVIRGNLTVAIIQGVIAGLGFFIFNVPNPVIWGSVAAIAALVPSLGTALVTVPAILYLVLHGNFVFAFGLLVWSFFAIGLIDNLLAPYLIQRGLRVHSFLILLSVFGGIILLGPIGFLIGPLILSIFISLLDIYSSLLLSKRN
jgi:predicted PurR-regulated permease PerM